ncbi:PQQ-binding-like beta-propeller repeat protein [Peterkaempfera bronchialis]|uniref:outer membrane protein assembly factor BamB family protein n=1 Tax=Peterkaempfera bronchialis TaxID=2126346 RepID=UPI003C30E9E4
MLRLRQIAVAAAVVLLLATDTHPEPHDAIPQVPVLTAVWSRAADAPDPSLDGGGFLVSDAVVVVPDRDRARGLVLLDPASGRERARIPPDPAARSVHAYLGVAERTLVVARGVGYAPGADVVTAYSVDTGQQLWRRQWPADREPDVLGTHLAVTRRGVLVLRGTPTRLESLDLSSGLTRWRATAREGCQLATSESLDALLVTTLCRGAARIRSIDPVSGLLWSDDLTPPGKEERPPTPIAVADGTVAVTEADSFRLYSAQGRMIARIPESLWAMGFTADTLLYESATDQGGHTRLHALDRSTGRPRWTAEGVDVWSVEGSHLAAADGVLYSTWIGWPLPAFVLTVDARTGTRRLLPLPTTATDSRVIGAAAGLVYVQTALEGDENARLTAYRVRQRPASDQAAGVVPPAAAWPNACTALTEQDLTFLAPGYVPIPRRRTLSDAGLTAPSQCDFLPPAERGISLTLSLDWVAPTAAAAHDLLRAKECAQHQVSIEPVTWLDPHSLELFESTPEGSLRVVYVQQGRYLVRLTATSHSAVLRRIAPLVRQRLTASSGVTLPSATGHDDHLGDQPSADWAAGSLGCASAPVAAMTRPQ